MVDSPSEVAFTIDSRLLEELGENLVTRNHVAVGELIKNAYDADATKVKLEFRDATAEDPSESEIRIIDDGNGMSLAEVRDDFMRIATTDKRRNPYSERYDRKKAGDKGIGRFACRRLSHILHLTTTTYLEEEDVYERTSLTIDWRRYESDQEIDEVKFEPTVERFSDVDGDPTGTTIQLIDLQDSWTQRQFDTLRRNVITLAVVEPQDRGGDYEPDPGFDIEFDAPEFEMGEGSLAEQVYDASWGCLEGEISDDGTVDLSLEAKLIGKRTYTFSYDTSGLGGTTFKIAYVPLDTKEHYRQPQTLNITDAREMTKDQSGIRVYKGGFRVFSYGGPEDDWVGVDQRKTTHGGRRPNEIFEDLEDSLAIHTDFQNALLSMPSNRNLIGRVMISYDADLTMASNREDFIDNTLFDELREIVLLSLEWLTLQWSHYKYEKSRKSLEEETKRFREQTRDRTEEKSDTEGDQLSNPEEEDEGEDVVRDEDEDEVIESALTLLEGAADAATDSLPEEERTVSDEAVETATKVIRNTIDQKEQEIDFFRSAFSVNQVVFSFSHELRSMVGSLDSSASKIEAVIDELPSDHQPRFKEVIMDLREMQDRFEAQMELFGIFMETGQREKASQQNVADIVEKVVEATEYIAEYYDVEISTSVPSLLRSPPMFKSELYSIVINLVTNSIKAVGASGKDNNKILVEAKPTDNGMRLRVYDNGVGIPEDAREEAFQPLSSDPADNIYENLSGQMPAELSEQLGKGTGLGLSIVRNIATKYDGTAQFVDADDWSACVEVTLSE